MLDILNPRLTIYLLSNKHSVPRYFYFLHKTANLQYEPHRLTVSSTKMTLSQCHKTSSSSTTLLWHPLVTTVADAQFELYRTGRQLKGLCHFHFQDPGVLTLLELGPDVRGAKLFVRACKENFIIAVNHIARIGHLSRIVSCNSICSMYSASVA